MKLQDVWRHANLLYLLAQEVATSLVACYDAERGPPPREVTLTPYWKKLFHAHAPLSVCPDFWTGTVAGACELSRASGAPRSCSVKTPCAKRVSAPTLVRTSVHCLVSSFGFALPMADDGMSRPRALRLFFISAGQRETSLGGCSQGYHLLELHTERCALRQVLAVPPAI